ncbi:MAG: hypothetical protein JOS17DRAFT_736852 [Linnemannia elongata]|nr:MAG: hypothetical protein JOS17DRAFT_736852 [Linnemannia elongata]
MYISLKAFTCSTLGTLLLLSILSDTPVAHARSLSQRREDINTSKLAATAAEAVDKRDLLGELIPTAKNGDPSSPASAPEAPAPAPAPAAAPAIPPSAPAPSSPPPAPAPEKKDPAPASDPAPSSPQKTQGGPGLVEQLLGGDSEPDPPKQESTSSSPQSTSSTSPPATSADRKKKPTQAAGITTGGSGSSRTDDDSSPNGGNAMTTSGLNGDQDPATATSGANGNNKNAATTPKEGLSSGIVAMIVLVVLGLLAAILLSCYRIRQSRVRRKEREECWDENILKNHVGTVGYNGGTNGSISGGSNGVGSIDVKSEALGDGGCHGATIEAAYAGRGSLGGSSLRDNQSVAGGNVYGGGGTYSPYSQHAHTYSQGFPQQQQGYGGGGYGGTYY